MSKLKLCINEGQDPIHFPYMFHCVCLFVWLSTSVTVNLVLFLLFVSFLIFSTCIQHSCVCVSAPPSPPLKGHPFAQPQRALGGHHRPGGRQAISQRGRRLSH